MDPSFWASETNRFRRFTPESLAAIEERIANKKKEEVKIKGKNKEQGVEEKRSPQLDLKTCKKLPSLYGDIPAELVGEPLEDFDPYYSDHKTFMVISKRRTIFRFTAAPALFIFGPFNPVRKTAIKILIHSFFLCIITCTVLLNCLAMTIPQLLSEVSWPEHVFTAIYTTEILIKIVARGFVCNEFTFLRDPWNCLDFSIIIVMYITTFHNVGNVSVLRTFRVLRTLKAISVIPGLKVIVNSLVESVKKLVDVLILTVFCLSVFALIGLQLFMGNLKSKCVLKGAGSNHSLCKDPKIYVPNDQDICSRLKDSSEILLCGYTGEPNKECPANYICEKTGNNPDFGYTSFDHFGWAFLSVFRLMTQDYWERLYRQTIRTSGVSCVFFFMAVIFFCSFYLFNLILAVVTMAYEEENRATHAETVAKEKLLQDAKQIIEKEQMLAVEESSKALHGGSEMPVADLKNSEGKESNKKTPTSRQNLILDDQENEEKIFHSQPDHCHKKLRQILLTYEVSVDAINDPVRRQRLMSAATILTDNSKSKLHCPTFWKNLPKNYLIWNCCPFWRSVKEKMKLVILNPFVDLLIMVCIILNTLFLAMEYPGMQPNYQRIISLSDKVFTLIFTIEMILKIIALDPYYYFQKKWNIFDSLVVLIGLASFGTNLSPFRLLRIFKLAKSWPALNTLMKIILHSFGALSNLTLVLAITVFIFAVVGVQILGSDYTANSSKISPSGELRWHMKDFCHSVLIIFRILCGEWIETMWECMEVAGKKKCLIIFLLVLVLGNLVVLNLFIALLLSSFNTDGPEGQENAGEGTKYQIAIAHIHNSLKAVKDRIWDHCCKRMRGRHRRTNKKKTLAEVSGKGIEVINYAMTDVRKHIDSSCFDIERCHMEDSSSLARKYEDILTIHSTCVPITAAEVSTNEGDDGHILHTAVEYRKQGDNLRHREQWQNSNSFNQSPGTSETVNVLTVTHPKKEQKVKYDAARSFSEASTVDPVALLEMLSQSKDSQMPKDCFVESCIECFPRCAVDITKFPGRTWWNFRKTCYRIVNHSGFEYFMIFMIVLSSAALAFEDIHLQKREKVKIILDYADKIFTYTFFMEMLLKWAAFGLHSYFTNSWCLLDFIIVCVSIILSLSYILIFCCSSGTSLKSLRTFRALRPLRALSRFEGIKVVVNALFGAIPSIFNVLLVCVVFWLLFNVLGVKWLGSRFWKCTFKKENNVSINNKSDCFFHNGTWTNNAVNFDNVGNGYLALLQVATFKGWMDIMYAAVDSREIDQQPEFEARLSMYAFFVVFIIFGSFFMLNLFIGVVISNFNQQRKKISGKDLFLTEEQKKYHNALKKLGSKKPQKPIPRPSNAFLGLLFDIVSHKIFDIIIMTFIFLNVIVMMAETNHKDTKDVLNKINYFFVAVFTAECVIKILALRHYYFGSGWNVFDFSVVVLSIVSLGVSEAFQSFFSPSVLRTLRLARIARVLRVIHGARRIQTLLFALLMSLPALVNIGLLLFLIMFIYAIVGMANFACLHWDGGIDDIFNFQTFCGSILCLFQITTSAGWDSLLAPVLKGSGACAPQLNETETEKNNCISKGFGIFYFVSYVIISFLIVVNMYIAVILENFSVATEESTDPLCEDDFDMFYETWGKFDPLATQFIDYSALSDFADALEEPLRIPKPNKIQLISMDIPIVSGDKIHYLDILLAFTKRVLGESGDLEDLELNMEEKIAAANQSKSCYSPISSTLKRKQEEVSAVVIQRAFRKYLRQRSLENLSLYHCKHNNAVFEREIQDKQSILESLLDENHGRKKDKLRPASSISLPLYYDGFAETDSNQLDT
ncbi:sodium channel protein type 5 subunit alpha-like [Cyanistes caeruleus]|uniref:sodium channel protein type 5 subunit alpha-like n=1 Tax=Cyanistes caeruleus TaxID=156563 RepID=UPI000CDB1A75|nr:sodium channel protein type 5 subunit alpha-like [Cyanistes caeruleus]